MRILSRCTLLLAFCIIFSSPPALAEDLVWLTGRVFAADRSTPVKDAVVAVYDEKNRVVDHAKTDSEGTYTLAVPRSALRLDKKGGGFFHRVAGGVNRLVGGIAGPLRMGIRAATSAIPVSGMAAQAGVGVASGVAQNMVATIKPRSKEAAAAPGSIVMKVTLPGKNDALGAASVYWIQEELYRTGRKEQRVLTAWMDPVMLTPAESTAESLIASSYLMFTDARLEPSIAEPGQSVILSATIQSPPEPRAPIVVVARNSKTGEIFLLSHAGGGRYKAEIQIGKKQPRHDQTISIVAYAEQVEETGRSRTVESAIERAGLFDPARPFVYNPLLVVSRNRAEVALTVVDSSRKKGAD